MIIVKVIFGISIGAESGIVKWTKEAFATSGRSKKMNDPIERADVYKALTTAIDEHIDIFDAIKGIPSADRPQGKWITYYPPMSDMQKSMCGVQEKGYVPDKRFGRSKCSLCGCGRPMYEDNYCPNCGAYMKGVDNEVL